MSETLHEVLHRSSASVFDAFLDTCVEHAGDDDSYGSPIEQALAIGMIAKIRTVYLWDTTLHFFPLFGLSEDVAKRMLGASSRSGGVFPQVSIGRHRVDFLALHLAEKGFGGLVIECDGHEFHERTKEQAQHDKARDRELQVRGYRVLRFTGSEIWRDPYWCAEEALQPLFNAALVAEGVLWAEPRPETQQVGVPS